MSNVEYISLPRERWSPPRTIGAAWCVPCFITRRVKVYAAFIDRGQSVCEHCVQQVQP